MNESFRVYQKYNNVLSTSVRKFRPFMLQGLKCTSSSLIALFNTSKHWDLRYMLISAQRIEKKPIKKLRLSSTEEMHFRKLDQRNFSSYFGPRILFLHYFWYTLNTWKVNRFILYTRIYLWINWKGKYTACSFVSWNYYCLVLITGASWVPESDYNTKRLPHRILVQETMNFDEILYRLLYLCSS